MIAYRLLHPISHTLTLTHLIHILFKLPSAVIAGFSLSQRQLDGTANVGHVKWMVILLLVSVEALILLLTPKTIHRSTLQTD